jgi:hypothetical protein
MFHQAALIMGDRIKLKTGKTRLNLKETNVFIS